jgi:HAD superfamily hydrolase (TIGR01490 family)
MRRTGIAFFDFDGTVVRGDSILPFIRYGIKTGFAPHSAAIRALWAYMRYAFHLIGADKAKEASLSFLRGKTSLETDIFAEAFYEHILKKRLYPAAVREINQLAREGFTILLVTASPDAYMNILQRKLAITDVIATRLALDEQSRYTGRLASANCSGFEKTLRVAEYLAAGGLEPDLRVSRSYGNSLSDQPMLELTRLAVLVNGSRKARRRMPGITYAKWSKRRSA